MRPLHHGSALVILGAGTGSNDPVPANPKAMAMLPLSKASIPDGAKPGDKIDVLVHGELSEDGKHLEVLKVDGAGSDEDDETEESSDASSDDDSTPGDRWDKAMKASKQGN